MREHLDDAHSGWRGLRSAYHHNSTQERVWDGLDLLDEPVDAWVDAIGRAADELNDFARACDEVLFRHRSLEILRPGVESERSAAISSEDPAQISSATTSVEYFNGEVADMLEKWAAIQADFAAGIRGITGGEEDALPKAQGIAAPGRVDWTGLGATVDADLRKDDAAWIAAELAAMDEAELREWLNDPANAVKTRLLAVRELPEHPAPGSAEATMKSVLEHHDPTVDRASVQAVKDAWLSLDESERTRLLYEYPGLFGNMNGIPFEDRGHINQITVVGYKEANRLALEKARKELDELVLGEEFSDAAYQQIAKDHSGAGGNAERLEKQRQFQIDKQKEIERIDALRADMEKEIQRLESLDRGFEQLHDAYDRPHHPSRQDVEEDGNPMTAGFDTLFVSRDNQGETVTARGQLGENTDRVIAFTPGTSTTLESTSDYNQKLDNMDGNDPEGTYSIYWAGTELPPTVPANVDPRFNEKGGPRVAAFDAALDAEKPAKAREVWVAHSAGNSMVGSGEAKGLTLDAMVYVAPSGPGLGVHGVEDTANPNAERYVIQHPNDPIAFANSTGAAVDAQGGIPADTTLLDGDGLDAGTANPVKMMGAVSLESGFNADGSRAGHEDGQSIIEGAEDAHVDYFDRESTTVENISGVLFEGKVYPEVGDGLDPGNLLGSKSFPYHATEDLPGASLDSVRRK